MFTFTWDETNKGYYYLMSDATGTGIDGNVRNLLPQYKGTQGSTVEAGYRDYQKVQDYETFRLLRMSTKLHDFRVFRRIETHVGIGQNSTFHEDKAQFFDPELGFFRNKGDGYPKRKQREGKGQFFFLTFQFLCKYYLLAYLYKATWILSLAAGQEWGAGFISEGHTHAVIKTKDKLSFKQFKAKWKGPHN